MGSDAENINGMDHSAAERLTHAIYGLQLATLITVLTFFVAVIINYVKRDDVAGTLFEAHFNWQIRTFWVIVTMYIIAFAVFLIAAIIVGFTEGSFVEVGILGLPFGLAFLAIPVVGFISVIYLIYRVAKGWIRLNEGRHPSD